MPLLFMQHIHSFCNSGKIPLKIEIKKNNKMCFAMNVVDGSSVVGTMNLTQYNSVSHSKGMVVLIV